MKFNVPTLGTMAHSWVQMFDSEYESFKAYAETYPDNCTLLVDTYNTLKSGIPNAIRVLMSSSCPWLPAQGHSDRFRGHPLFIKESRRMLDEAGFSDCQIWSPIPWMNSSSGTS